MECRAYVRSPWHSCDSQRNIGHDGRLSALGVRSAGLRTTTMSALREAGVDSQAPPYWTGLDWTLVLRILLTRLGRAGPGRAPSVAGVVTLA